MSRVLMAAGFLFGVFNLIPIPWRVRVFWMRLLYEVIAKSTVLFPSILSWTQKQNKRFKMGKQEGEDYESLVQLEKVLEYFDKSGVSTADLKRAVDLADEQNIPSEAWGGFLTRTLLTPDQAEKLLKESLQAGRY